VVLQVANVDIGRGLMIAMSNIRIAGVMMKWIIMTTGM
jgi:hypothetical protein